MSGYLWKATVRNVNRALKEINAFEREGDYRPAARKALKSILEKGQGFPLSIDQGLTGGDQVVLVINHFDIIARRLLGPAKLPCLGSKPASRNRGREIGDVHV